MHTIDWIAIGVVLLAMAIGALLGFGKQLKIFTGGIVGFLISFVVTYFCLGVVSSWGFVQDLMAKLHETMVNANNGIVNFLIKIGIEKIILAVGLFIVVTVIRVIVVNIIKGVVEIDNTVFKVINRVLGVIFALAVTVMVALLVFHIIDLIGGGTEAGFVEKIKGSVFKLDWVYEHNPMQYIFKKIGI